MVAAKIFILDIWKCTVKEKKAIQNQNKYHLPKIIAYCSYNSHQKFITNWAMYIPREFLRLSVSQKFRTNYAENLSNVRCGIV